MINILFRFSEADDDFDGGVKICEWLGYFGLGWQFSCGDETSLEYCGDVNK